MKNKSLLISLILALALGAAGFWGGMKYQQSKIGRFTSRNFDRNGVLNPRSNGQAQNNFRPFAGEILSIDEKSLTVKLPDGSSKIVILGNSTVIYKSESATKEDLKVGEKISVFGSLNQDGSVTASNIQIGSLFRGQNQ